MADNQNASERLEHIVRKNKSATRYVTLFAIVAVVIGFGAVLWQVSDLSGEKQEIKQAKASIEDSFHTKQVVLDSLMTSEESPVVKSKIKDTIKGLVKGYLEERDDEVFFNYYADTVKSYFDNKEEFTRQEIKERKRIRGRSSKIEYNPQDILVTVNNDGTKEAVFDAKYYWDSTKVSTPSNVVYHLKFNRNNKIFAVKSGKLKKYEAD